MKVLYSLLLLAPPEVVVVLVGGRLTGVASADCKIEGVKIIAIRAMTTGNLLRIQERFVLHCCHLLLKSHLSTPAQILPTMIERTSFLA